jgi:hypothetical protein
MQFDYLHGVVNMNYINKGLDVHTTTHERRLLVDLYLIQEVVALLLEFSASKPAGLARRHHC